MKNDFSSQFNALNKEIVLSINAKNYARATLLDQARQEILRDLSSSHIDMIDAEFLSILEESAHETSKLIDIVENDMKKISHETCKTVRIHQGYSLNP